MMRYPVRIPGSWVLLLLAHGTSGDLFSSLPISDSPATCHAATINYITHTLAQQCLATPRSKPVTAVTRDDFSATEPLSVSSERSSSEGGATNHVSSLKITTLTVTSTTSVSTLAVPLETLTVTPSSSSVNASSSIHPESFTSNTQMTPVTQPSSNATTISPQASSDLVLVTIQSPSPTTVTQAPNEVGAPLPSQAASDDDGDSVFGDTNFLSFEEWKKRNLARSGQSVDSVGQGRTAPVADRSRPGAENSLESLGEDSEIELDFSGFGGPANVPVRDMPLSDDSKPSETTKEASPSSMPRSRDAGKTGKQRSNYASFDCAANVLKTNAQCSHSSAILVENKDSYMLNKCAADGKFIIVELCDDILIDTIVLANFEFFSSTFRTFKVSVSDKYPVKADRWKELGIFEARNSRDIQAFLVENPLIWARYLRIEFLTHYGNEYYCPVSLLRVHGTTMMAEFRHQEELARGEVDNDDEDEVVESNVSSPSPVVPDSVEEATLDNKTTASVPAESYEPVSEQLINGTNSASSDPKRSDTSASSSRATSAHTEMQLSTTREPLSPSVHAEQKSRTSSNSSEKSPTHTVEVSDCVALSRASNDANTLSTSSTETNTREKPQASFANITTTNSSKQASAESSKPPAQVPSPPAASTTSSHTKSSSISVASSTPSVQPPATQESFFKSIHKRLQFLESNATLSLQYIESQSLQFREAFGKVEKRNLVRTSTFLNALNATVSAELAQFKSEYEQLWQSTVLELASQRDENRKEAALMAERYRMLAEELVGQKRLIAVQATLLLLCLGLVVFSKFLGGSGASSGVDAGLVQLINELVPRARRGKGSRDATTPSSSPRWEGIWTPSSPTADVTSPRDPSTEDEVDSRQRNNGTATIPEVDENGDDSKFPDLQGTPRLTKSAPTTPGIEVPIEMRVNEDEDESFVTDHV